MKRYVLAAAIVCVGVGCNRSPAGPTPMYQAVAGDYVGSATISIPEAQSSLPYAAATRVLQSGASVNIAPIVLTGPSTLSLPMGPATIDEAGTFILPPTMLQETCGTYTLHRSGTFVGLELHLSGSATSATCVDFHISTVLTR